MTGRTDDLGGWPGILQMVFRGENLTPAAMEIALDEVLDGGVDPIIVAAFVAALRTKGETVDELTGLVAAMRSHGESVVTDRPVIDTCGTGGDRLGTVNVSTTAAVI